MKLGDHFVAISKPKGKKKHKKEDRIPFFKLGDRFRSGGRILERGDFSSCEMGVRRCKVALVCQRVVSQLRNTLPNGVSTAKFPLNFARSSSNDHNFFVSTPNCTPFEALDS